MRQLLVIVFSVQHGILSGFCENLFEGNKEWQATAAVGVSAAKVHGTERQLIRCRFVTEVLSEWKVCMFVLFVCLFGVFIYVLRQRFL